MARYWYALDNGMTNPPGFDQEELTPYVQNEDTFVCPGGGTYTVDPTTACVVCSIPEHMFDTCKGSNCPQGQT
jgi:hypothetical protein